jgi:hypothetical protein
MMRILKATLPALALVSLGACDRQPAQPKPTLHEIMVGSVDPVADVIWGETNKAYNDDGDAAPHTLTEADWVKVQQAARQLHEGAMAIANDPAIEAVRPGVKILDEGNAAEAASAAQVASYLERDRPGLARHAHALADIALQIESAANS